MPETRRLTIWRRRFKKPDLRALGAIFISELEAARAAGRRATVAFELKCDDGTEYAAEDMRLFAEGAEVDLKRLKSIEFGSADAALSRWITLSLNHNSVLDSSLRVSGEGGDQEWVAGVFTRLQERVAASEPSESWFTRHPTLTYLLALGCGSLILFALNYAINVGIAHGVVVPSDGSSSPPPGSIRLVFSHVPALEFAVVWFLRWFIGGLAAMWLRDWIVAAWPTLDIDVGPEHLKLERIRRSRIVAFLVLGALPFLIQFVYDITKTALRTA